jgi:hypothetical protein
VMHTCMVGAQTKPMDTPSSWIRLKGERGAATKTQRFGKISLNVALIIFNKKRNVSEKLTLQRIMWDNCD